MTWQGGGWVDEWPAWAGAEDEPVSEPIPPRPPISGDDAAELDLPGDIAAELAPLPPRAVNHGDAIAVELPSTPFLQQWTAAVNAVALGIPPLFEGLRQAAQETGRHLNVFAREIVTASHRSMHRSIIDGIYLRNHQRLMPDTIRRWKRCPICRPYSNPAALKGGHGPAYARRRRHR